MAMALSALLLASTLMSSPLPVTAVAGSSSALAGVVENGQSKRVEISYEGRAIGLKIGEMSMTADIGPRGYTAKGSLQTAGVARWFSKYNISTSSTGRVENSALQSVRYDSRNRDGKKNRQVRLDWTPQDVSVFADPWFGNYDWNPNQQQRLSGIDPVSALLNLSLGRGVTPERPCGSPISVFDGKQRYDLRLTYIGKTQVREKGYRGPAAKCQVSFIPIAGFQPKEKDEKSDLEGAYFYLTDFATVGFTAPVVIEVNTGSVGKVRLVAQTAKVTTIPGQRAQTVPVATQAAAKN
jgi:hypothetical protein